MTQFSSRAKQSYDLEERTAKFGEELIELIKKVEKNDITRIIIRQLIRSGTSIGANYYEANAASSSRDFRNKIYLCKKETNKTKFSLRMLAKANPQLKESIRKLWSEAHELHLIFQKTTQTIDKKKK